MTKVRFAGGTECQTRNQCSLGELTIRQDQTPLGTLDKSIQSPFDHLDESQIGLSEALQFRLPFHLASSPTWTRDSQRIGQSGIPLPDRTLGITLQRGLFPTRRVPLTRSTACPLLNMPTSTTHRHYRLTWVSLGTFCRSVTRLGTWMTADFLWLVTCLSAFFTLTGRMA